MVQGLAGKESDLPSKKDGVPGWIVGAFERLLAFTLFALQLEDGYTILIAWMAAKLASNRQRRPWPKGVEDARQLRARTFIALMAGTLSLAFGILGGTIADFGCH